MATPVVQLALRVALLVPIASLGSCHVGADVMHGLSRSGHFHNLELETGASSQDWKEFKRGDH